jgi:hypothetical protein
MPVITLRAALRSWALALALSAAMVAAGDRWPDPLAINPVLVWSLVLLPPALMAVTLLLNWSAGVQRAPAGEGGESGD